MAFHQSKKTEVITRIESAAARSGRPQSAVQLVAVSKTWPISEVQAAADAGLRVFGENRVQELEEKAPALATDFALSWHFIGHLQKNKIRKVLSHASCIESVDSLAVAIGIDRIAGEMNLRPKVFLQVNIGEDERKFGLSASEVTNNLESFLQLPHLEVAGLMTIPPLGTSPEDARPHFVALRELRDRLSTQGGNPLRDLSMGMSGDYEVAIEEGATNVRVGTGIFGNRAAR